MKKSKYAAALGLAMLLAMGTAGATHASQPTATPSARQAHVESHCWLDVTTKQSTCASSPEELAEKVLFEFGVEFVGEVPADSQLT